MMFSRPNTFDVNRDIIKPSEEALQAARGKEGKLTFLGKELNPNWCVDMARELAKAGQQAKARMKMRDGAAIVKKDLTEGHCYIRHRRYYEHGTKARCHKWPIAAI